jgi:hypothetical protein
VERAIKNFNELLDLGTKSLYKSSSALTVQLNTGSSRTCLNGFEFRGDGMEEIVSKHNEVKRRANELPLEQGSAGCHRLIAAQILLPYPWRLRLDVVLSEANKYFCLPFHHFQTR